MEEGWSELTCSLLTQHLLLALCSALCSPSLISVLTTTSTLPGLEGTAFGNPYSFVDGGCANSTGTAYFYASSMDQSMIDIEANTAVSFALSEALFNNDPRLEQKACVVGASGDPENPPCARSVMSGTFRKVEDSSDEVRL